MPTLREILKEKLLLQQDIYEATGLSKSAISRAVSGKPVQRTTYLIICRELNIDPDSVTGVTIHRPHKPARAAQPARKRA